MVPYHAHSDFIQLGAELGVIGFSLYLGIFLLVIFFAYKLIIDKKEEIEKKFFIFFLVVFFCVLKSCKENLNFPIASQVFSCVGHSFGTVTIYYRKV